MDEKVFIGLAVVVIVLAGFFIMGSMGILGGSTNQSTQTTRTPVSNNTTATIDYSGWLKIESAYISVVAIKKESGELTINAVLNITLRNIGEYPFMVTNITVDGLPLKDFYGRNIMPKKSLVIASSIILDPATGSTRIPYTSEWGEGTVHIVTVSFVVGGRLYTVSENVTVTKFTEFKVTI